MSILPATLIGLTQIDWGKLNQFCVDNDLTVPTKIIDEARLTFSPAGAWKYVFEKYAHPTFRYKGVCAVFVLKINLKDQMELSSRDLVGFAISSDVHIFSGDVINWVDYVLGSESKLALAVYLELNPYCHEYFKNHRVEKGKLIRI